MVNRCKFMEKFPDIDPVSIGEAKAFGDNVLVINLNEVYRKFKTSKPSLNSQTIQSADKLICYRKGCGNPRRGDSFFCEVHRTI